VNRGAFFYKCNTLRIRNLFGHRPTTNQFSLLKILEKKPQHVHPLLACPDISYQIRLITVARSSGLIQFAKQRRGCYRKNNQSEEVFTNMETHSLPTETETKKSFITHSYKYCFSLGTKIFFNPGLAFSNTSYIKIHKVVHSRQNKLLFSSALQIAQEVQ